MSEIRLKNVIMEDFLNYRKPSMFLITCFCDWKCCTERNIPLTSCQNKPIHELPTGSFSFESLYRAYIGNPITKAVVIGGLEPLIQFNEIYGLIKYFRDKGCNDTFVIYSGYTETEVENDPMWSTLKGLGNIIIKYGRFVPNQKPHFDEVLGVELISDNQYAKRY